ncbi:MAG TPA: hypothetical protein VFP58_13775, partial [Candidatus Eisenbacteria bacterium]|nr:hypothetical protein [Candidatus Eisenbacteria bacterium]
MIWGWVHLAACLLLGIALVRLLPIRFYLPELASAACLAGLLSGTVITLASVCFLGYGAGVWVAIAAMAAISAAALARRSPQSAGWVTPMFPRRGQAVAWLLLTLATGGVLGWLFLTHMLWERGGVLHTGGGTWGDLALHMSLITRFAEQARFTWDMPVYHGSKLSYPFLIDFTSGVLLRQGLSVQASLIIPGLLLSLAFVQLLFFLAYRWFRSVAAAVLAVVMFLANGSPAGLAYFWKDWQASGVPLQEFLLAMKVEYAHLGDHNLRFSNIVADYFLPQRGVLYGLPAFTLATLLLWQAWSRPEARTRLLLGTAILLGLLPFAHVHTYLVLIGVWGWLALVAVIRERRLTTAWVGFLLLGLLLSAPQLSWQLGASYGSGFSKWYFGWMRAPDESILTFWLRNMGPGFVFVFANLVFVWRLRRQDPFLLHFYLPLVALFVLTNVYLFQPHAYDNMKFMLYSYLALCLVLGAWLARWLWGPTPLPALAALLVVAMTLCGAISILRESYTVWPFHVAEDVDVAKRFQQVVPPESRVLTSDQHNHFVPTLAGRRIVMGYRGWLWTHGVDYSTLERDVGSMYEGDSLSVPLFQRYGVEYVVIGPSERSSF